jgi:Skp family chaperone for outer membrane proteins
MPNREVLMRRIGIVSLMALFFLLGATLAYATIYTWTDANGVKRYSNSQPPENAKNVKTIEETHSKPGTEERNREAYDRMVEDASKSADREFKKQAEKKAQEAAARQKQRQKEQAQRVARERERLQKKIDAISGRGLGPTFTAGMKANLIKQVQDQIDRLERDPEAYFKHSE